MRPRLLDLYCKAGGCSMGYHRAGFDVVGVDIAPGAIGDGAITLLGAMLALGFGTVTCVTTFQLSGFCRQFLPEESVYLAFRTGKKNVFICHQCRDSFFAAP